MSSRAICIPIVKPIKMPIVALIKMPSTNSLFIIVPPTNTLFYAAWVFYPTAFACPGVFPT